MGLIGGLAFDDKGGAMRAGRLLCEWVFAGWLTWDGLRVWGFVSWGMGVIGYGGF